MHYLTEDGVLEIHELAVSQSEVNGNLLTANYEFVV